MPTKIYGSGSAEFQTPLPAAQYSAKSGAVLQVRSFKAPSIDDAYTTIADSTNYLTPITILFTPLSTNSTLYIEVDVHTRIIAAFGVSILIYRDGVATDGNFNVAGMQVMQYKGDAINHHYQSVAHAEVLNTSLVATRFDVYLRPLNGIGEYSRGWGRNSIKVTEVAN